MTETSTSSKKIKTNDRVRRVAGFSGMGTVKDVREESIISSVEVKGKERPVMINVQWDNGTLSYMGPEAIEVVKE